MAKPSKIAKEGGAFRRCPYCKSFLPPALPQRTYLDKDGHYINITFKWQFRRATFEECRKCRKQWPLFEDYEDIPSSDISITETSRSEEFIGNEGRRIENKTAATIQRTVLASKEWTRQIEFDTTLTSLKSSETKFAIKDTTLTTKVQKSVQERYNMSIGETRKFEEGVVIAVPANTSIEAVFIWKRIWQNGYAELKTGQARVPFRLCVGVTFDLRQDKIR